MEITHIMQNFSQIVQTPYFSVILDQIMMKSLFLLLLFCHVSSPVKHSFKTLYTVTSGFPNLPELMISVLVDNVQAGYCDSNKTISVNHDVWKKLFKDNPGLLDLCTEQCVEIQPKHFKSRLDRIMQHFNQTEGVHILQYMESCESDEQTGITSLVEGGYDGEDFRSFNVTKQKWTSQKPEADVIKQELEADKGRLEETVYLLTQTSSVWLKLALNYGESFLLRTELPSVSLVQKSPSSPVSCHATGFYPDRATMFWRKDGQELHEDVDHGEILPNHDGTFQMRVDLKLSSVKPEDWRRYDCVFLLSGVKDDVTTKLDKAVIRSNEEKLSDMFVPIIAAVVVGLVLVVIVVVIGAVMYKKKKKDKKTPLDDSPQKESVTDDSNGSEGSDTPLNRAAISTDVMEQLNPTNYRTNSQT